MFECNQESAGLFSAKEKKVLKSAIAQRIDAYFFAVRQQNIDTMLEFWADSDEFAFAADGNVLVGYDEFARQMRQATQMTDSVLSLSKYNEHIYILSSDAAKSTLQFEGISTITNGDTVCSRGLWTYVFTLMNDEWKVIHSAGTHIYY